MTDNEIKKALECHANNTCHNCPLEYIDGTCGTSLCSSALDLINRIQAEKQDLFYKLIGVMHSVDKWLDGDELKQDEVNRATTMREKTLQIVESLQAENEKMRDINEKLTMDIHAKEIVAEAEIVRNAKSEAYKECIEKVKKEIVPALPFNFGTTSRALDNLLKELVGEDK